MVKCAVCEKEFENDKKLHSHLRAHKLRMVEYYQKHFPRYDKHDNKIIKFKNKEQYFNTEFNTRTNLRMWLKGLEPLEAKSYCRNLLAERKEKRNISYAPTQVELRSIISPPIQYFHELFGDYYLLCEELGLKNKHGKCTSIVSGSEYDKSSYKILVDTREQKPLKFHWDIEIKKLDYGDYAFSSEDAIFDYYIERKMLSDFIGTISGGYDRFINEIERAQENNVDLTVVVEESINNALGFKFLPHISKKIKATPDFIFHRVRNIIQKYPHVQFLFVNGREESTRVIERIFTAGGVHRKVDLQLMYDLKIL